MSEHDTESQRQLRAMAVANALASSLLAGLSPSPIAVANLSRYIEGEVTLKALIEDAKRRHASTG